MKNISRNLLQFYIDAEKLKTTLRHSWTSDTTRQESTAEHSWMLSLIAMTLFEHMEMKIDQLKVLKILIIHDLAEAITGDVPAFDKKGRVGKYEREKNALKQLIKPLSTRQQKEFLSLWEEIETKETVEAKLAQVIDKLEAALQHCIAGTDTWDQNDYDHHGAFYKCDYSQTGETLKHLRDAIGELSIKKVVDAKQLDRLNEDIIEFYKQKGFKSL